jgi:hypothetical protein
MPSEPTGAAAPALSTGETPPTPAERGMISVPQMARAGLWLNLVAIAVIATATVTLVDWVMGR